MIEYKKYPFVFEDNDYEIKVLFDDSTINVVAFLNNYPANGFRHLVKIPKTIDIKKLLNNDAVKNLVDLSKEDIINKRWENISRIIYECK